MEQQSEKFPNNNTNKINVDRLLGLSAILISLLTLIIFIYQTNIIHQQSRLSVTPRLSFNVSQTQKDSSVFFDLLLENKGIGPAIINSSMIIEKGKSYDLDMSEFWKERYPELAKFGVFRSTSAVGKGSTLSAGESKILFSYELFDAAKFNTMSEYLTLDENGNFPFNIIIVYSSIYEEKWKIDYQENGHPVKL